VVFLVLAGSGVATAVWTASGGTITASTTPGSLTVTQTGFTSLAKAYSSSALTTTAPVTVSNSGNVPAPYTLTIKSAATTGLSTATTVVGWSVTSAANCTASTAVGSGSVSATLTAGISSSLQLAAGDIDYFCVRTSITSAYASANAGASSVAQGSLVSALGNWTSNSTATAAQSIPDTTAPTVPTKLAASATSTTAASLTWTASTDNVAVTGYDVYKGGTLLATVTTTSYTASGLTKGTAYSFTVRAHDAAGNNSAQTTAVSVTTPLVDTGVKYRLLNANSGLCVDAGTGTPASGAAMQIYACSTSRVQNWTFVKASAGYYAVVPSNATSLGWDVGGGSTSTYSSVGLYTYSGGANEQWMPVALTSTTMHIVNLNSGLCLWVSGNAKASGTQIQQYTCDSSLGETFTYSVVS
jgi:hypothetical protein